MADSTTEQAKAVLDELTAKGVEVDRIQISRYHEGNRAEFVAYARNIGADTVRHGTGGGLYATRRNDGPAALVVHAMGPWWNDVAPSQRDAVVEELRRGIVAVHLDDAEVSV